MKALSKKRVFIFAVLFALVIFGQEQIKLGINFYLQTTAQWSDFDTLTPSEKQLRLEGFEHDSREYGTAHRNLPFLSSFSRKGVQIAKWIFAIFFVAVHFVLSLLLIKGLWGNTLNKFLIYFYVIASVVCVALLAVGVAANHMQSVYPLARRILGVLQSPIPAIIIGLSSFIKTNKI